MADYTEPLLATDRLSDVTGVTHSVNSPTKDASNPLFPTSVETDAWDEDKLSVNVHKDANGWHMYYIGFDGTDYNYCYASSVDGVTWTKPNLGLVSYGGNTNNNLLGQVGSSVRYEPAITKWVGAGGGGIPGADDLEIRTSDAPDEPFTLVKVLNPIQAAAEGHSLLRRPSDGRWVFYYNAGHAAEERSIYAIVSDTTELAESWTEHGLVLASPASTNQHYAFGTFVQGDFLYGFANRYNSTSEQLWFDLFRSYDGIAWTLVDATWVDVGAGGAWDDEMLLLHWNLAEDGDDWHIYYAGSPENHAAAHPRDSRIGRVTIGRSRIGQVTGTGSITTDPIAVTVGASLTVNALAAGGTLDIEVQNEAGTPLAGFAQADFDTISTDSFDHSPTWGGVPMPADQTVRLKFVLSSSTLHSFQITNDPFADDFTGTNGNPWDTVKWDTSAGAGGGTTTIQGNKGRASGSTGNANSGGRGIGRQGAVANQKITGEFTLCQVDEPCRVSIWAQTSNDWNGLDSPTDGYGVYLPADSDIAQLVVVSSGVETVLDTASWPRDVGTKEWEFRRSDRQVRFRIWESGGQPGGWLLGADDETSLAVDGVGAFQVAYACPTAPSVDACADFDDIDVGENTNRLPVPGFNVVVSGRRADFADTSTDPDGTITAWAWTFGDGATSTLRNPSHTYDGPGTYTATLTVTDDSAEFDSTSEQIEVSSPGVDSFDCSFSDSFEVDPDCTANNRLGGQGAVRKPPRPNPATR